MGSKGTSEHARLRVVVVGAGIGGLTAAIGLRLDGHEVVVLEQAAEFGEVSNNLNAGLAGDDVVSCG